MFFHRRVITVVVRRWSIACAAAAILFGASTNRNYTQVEKLKFNRLLHWTWTACLLVWLLSLALLLPSWMAILSWRCCTRGDREESFCRNAPSKNDSNELLDVSSSMYTCQRRHGAMKKIVVYCSSSSARRRGLMDV